MKKQGSTSHVSGFWVFLFWIVATILMSVESRSQETPSLFVVADFMKVSSDNHANYLDVEQNIWKPLHQERINRGIIAGWYLYAVEFSGALDDYNYVVITLYDNAANLENPWSADILEQVHPKLKLEEIMRRTNNSRVHAKSELFYNVTTVPKSPLENPAAYMQVNYMNVEPGMQSAYEQLESEIWLPIHNEAIRTGRTKGWSLWSALFPRGAGRPYQYITLNAFSEYDYVFQLDFSIPFQTIHPDKDFADVQVKTQNTRRIVRTELWDLIDYVIR